MHKTLKRPVVDETLSEGNSEHLLHTYLEWMGTQGYAYQSIKSYKEILTRFIAWCALRDITTLEHVDPLLLDRYKRHLYYYRKDNGEPLSYTSQNRRLQAVRGFFKYLARQRFIPYNPASELELPKVERKLPAVILTSEEVDQVMNQCDLTSRLGIRDRAMLETLYSTGIRRNELVGLSVHDIDHARGTIFIRQGKGKRDRVIPVGERALAWINKYIHDVRPSLVKRSDEDALFLSTRKQRISPMQVGHLMHHYIKEADLHKQGACHIFRHSMATLMLEHGADVRYIQKMLGHVHVTTTEVYTHVSIKKLKEVHTKTHPGANLERRKPDQSHESI